MSRSSRHILVLVAIALAVAACASGTGESKAGGAAPPLVLKIGTNDSQGKPASNQIEEYARRVAELSADAIRIEPVWHAAGDGPDHDQRVARMVTDGGLHMALIPSRAWDTEGVTSLRALNAPFLITSDELVAEVISSELADEMLAGLEEVGVVGLALFPEGLRHPFGFEAPLLGPDDYAGRTIRTPTSEVTKAMFEALGATVTDGERDEATQAGMESAYVLEPWGVATGNVTFYPKVNSLVIAANTFERLTSEQQDILERAAADTTEWAIDTVLTDQTAAGMFCEFGHGILLATDAQLAALEEATKPVNEWLGEDGQTKELIARISQLKEDLAVSTASPATCEPPSQQTVTGTSIGEVEAADFPEGTYRMEIKAEFLLDAGMREATARDHAGIWTLTFEDGQLLVGDVDAATGVRTEDKGVYCVGEGRISLGLIGKPPTCGDFWSAGWKLEGDQLQFVDVRSHHGFDLLIETLFGGQPFTKID